MRTLSNDECETWCEESRADRIGEFHVLVSTPRDSHVQAQFARFLIDWIGPFDEALLWHTDWPFYRPDEMALIDGLRRSHGETRRLIEAPGHLFTQEERPELVGWVFLTLGFRCDSRLRVRPFRGDSVDTSHHDWVAVCSATRERLVAVKEAVSQLGLRT